MILLAVLCSVLVVAVNLESPSDCGKQLEACAQCFHLVVARNANCAFDLGPTLVRTGGCQSPENTRPMFAISLSESVVSEETAEPWQSQDQLTICMCVCIIS